MMAVVLALCVLVLQGCQTSGNKLNKFSYTGTLPKCSLGGIKHNCYGKSDIPLSSEWHNGSYYQGEWQNDNWHGYGAFYSADKRYIHEGQYVRGKRYGKGTTITSKWEYVGEYKDNNRHGQGTITYKQDQGYGVWKKGDRYEGEWTFDTINGYGIYTHANGKIQQGLWNHRKFVKSQQFKNIEKNYVKQVKSNISENKPINSIDKNNTLASNDSNNNLSIKSAKTFSVLNSKSSTSNKPVNVASNSSNTCSILQNKILKHIDDGQYDQASAARKLMKEMDCSSSSTSSSLSSSNSSSTNTETYVQPKNTSKYSSSQLSCSVGPLGKYMFRDYGNYYARAFDNNPQKACNATFQYCKSRARAIAKGAKIAPSERSPNSYSADCNITGTNRFNTRADCTVTPDSAGGGFAGGFANELGKGIARQTAMKRIYVSNFEICMSEMGYSLTEQ